ncbi:MAG TPA: glycosyltransferase family 2 protein [Patescibacteria group bacterium]|nr:glycosyltransferase family 2 protein [Patescibacteria group bacterium]
MKISIVILNYKSADITINCLRSLRKINTGKEKIEIIVVDNNSGDDIKTQVLNNFPEVILLENSVNLGFSGGSNEGARYALKNGADAVLFLNNDTIVDKNLVLELAEEVNKDEVGGVVPKIYFEKGYEFHKARYKKEDLGKVIWYAGGRMDWSNLIGQNVGVDEVDNGQFDDRKEIKLATGCCFMVSSKTLNRVGLYDDKYFLYYEDADLSERINRAGLKIIYQPKAILWHKNAGSSGGSGSELQDYYISRNRMLFGMKYAPIKTKTALIKESLRLLTIGRKWQKKGIKDYYRGKFGKGSYNI